MRRSILTVTLFAVALASHASAQYGHGQFSSPRNAGTEHVSVTYNDPDGKRQTVAFQVELKKGESADSKAQKIVDGLNAAGGLSATTLDGGGVFFGATGGGEVRTFSVTNNTGEKTNKHTTNGNVLHGFVSFAGSSSGLDGYGEPAVAMVGTNAGTVTVPTGGHTPSSLVSALVEELTAQGVSAAVVGDAELWLPLAEGEHLHWGNTDAGLSQTATVAVVDADSDEGE